MKRVQYDRYGGPDVLTLGDADTPTPGPGQMLMRVRAAATNAMDWKIRRGEMWALTGRKFPRGVGHDFAGIIEQVGKGMTGLKVGDEVLGAERLQHAGAFAEYVIVDQKSVAHMPDTLAFTEAATLSVAGLTAYQAVTKAGNLQSGQNTLINGCHGGVGRIAVQVATGVGASVTGSCRTGSENEAYQLDVNTVLTFDFDPAPPTGRFEVVFDTAGLLQHATALGMLAPDGRIIDIVTSMTKFARSILAGPYKALLGKSDRDNLQHVANAAGRGDITTHIHSTVTLTDAIPAHIDPENPHLQCRETRQHH